jgi:gamma-glutamyltranspeptidase/glutathione hydrolase
MRILVVALLCAAIPSLAQTNDTAPEASTGRQERQAVHARHAMVATANRFASRAGDEILRAGGSALDAAIAAQLVLNLVEPQSSGIGGGGFLLHWDSALHKLSTYDGRETAPAAARPDRFLGPDGKPIPFEEAIESGLSVGVPGVLRLLELTHARHGRLRWSRLFQPAIRLAESGFPVSPRLHALLASDPALARNAAARAYFYDAGGRAWPVGHVLRNPALATTLRRIAREGADAFYRGAIARDIVAAVATHPRPGDLTESDLAGYRAIEREPLCGSYRAYRICSVPPPSSGGLGVLELLGLLERFDLAQVRPGSSAAVHLFSEAGRLAYADRDHYVGDPAFVQVPVAGLLERDYLRRRSELIQPDHSMGRAAPGEPRGARQAFGADATLEAAGTSHLSVVDARGNAVAFTSTIESQFGSRIFVHGFLLNNQLTDFSFIPEAAGRPLANRVEAGKRPRSALAPTLVFGADGALRANLGAPGGSQIINYVAKTLVALLDWNMDIQQAIAAPNMGSRNQATEIEQGSALESVAASLRAMGHTVSVGPQTSGVHGITAGPAGLTGGADPRREGVVLGN